MRIDDKIRAILDELTDEELIQMTKDMYEWKYINNYEKNENSLLYEKWITLKRTFGGMDNFSLYILNETERRFGYLVKLLMINNPSSFIK